MGMHLHGNKMVKILLKMELYKVKIKEVSIFKNMLNFWNKEFKNVQKKTKDF